MTDALAEIVGETQESDSNGKEEISDLKKGIEVLPQPAQTVVSHQVGAGQQKKLRVRLMFRGWLRGYGGNVSRNDGRVPEKLLFWRNLSNYHKVLKSLL